MPPNVAPAELAPEAGRADATLIEIVRRFGTPAFAYDLDRIRAQVAGLRAELPSEVDILYSVKANPLPRLCRLLAGEGLGAEVASAAELRRALATGFPPERILVNGPYKHPDLLAAAEQGVVLSVDSISELAHLARLHPAPRVLLRLRPDFAPDGLIPMGPTSRFGIPADELAEVRPALCTSRIEVVGFHVYAGSQILRAGDAVANLRRAFTLCERAADVLDVSPSVLGLGGGFGIPYGPRQPDALDLAPVAAELERLGGLATGRLMLELGRYLVAPAGWYLTGVVHEQHYAGRVAAVVDGGTHHRPDLCGLDLPRASFPPRVYGPQGQRKRGGVATTDIVGCLCLPWDVLAEQVSIPAPRPGDVLAFADSGAYGVTAAPHSFIGHAPPTEVVFDHTGVLHASRRT